MDMRAHDNQRLSRRIPLGCNALLRPHSGEEVYSARCAEIGTGGMTLETEYVPRVAEELDVLVREPGSGITRPPLHVRVKVKRCHRAASGRYVLGVQITKVLK